MATRYVSVLLTEAQAALVKELAQGYAEGIRQELTELGGSGCGENNPAAYDLRSDIRIAEGIAKAMGDALANPVSTKSAVYRSMRRAA